MPQAWSDERGDDTTLTLSDLAAHIARLDAMNGAPGVPNQHPAGLAEAPASPAPAGIPPHVNGPLAPGALPAQQPSRHGDGPNAAPRAGTDLVPPYDRTVNRAATRWDGPVNRSVATRPNSRPFTRVPG